MFQKLRARFKSTKPNRHARKNRDDQPPPPSTNDDDDRVATKTDTCVSSSDVARTDNTPRRNLWEVAEERLDERHREALELESASSVTKAIEGVIRTTEQKYREYKEGGLKIRKRDGGQINVRDSAKNIILYALQAQELVKTLASFDPTGHASSAWSIVSFGLTLLQNDFQRRDDIFEAAEYLARNLAYYAIVDSHYRERQVGSDQGLEDALVEVYMAVLQYAAEVKEAEKESKATRTLKSITALIQQPLKDLKNTIEDKAQAVQKWTRLTEDLDRKREAESMLDGIDEAVERLKSIQSHAESVQDLEILDWLSTASYSDSQISTLDHRASKTGNWFLDLPEYKEWKATPGKICWLYGAVGCGKSVLCSTIIHDIQHYCTPGSTKHLAYWYFQFSNDATQKVYNMIRSILRQFMPKALPAPMIKLWEEHRHRGSKPQQQKLAEILDIVLEASQGQFFLVLDALDECPAKAGERGSLLHFLEELRGKHRTKLHIIATSRPEPDIRLRLEQHQCVNLETGLAEDVEYFVRAQVAHGRLCQWDESIRKQTLKRLLDIPERRFRWADLQIKRLEESKTKDAFYKALDSIPVTLEDTYRDTLERLSPDDREAARTILIWLSFSAVPLDLKTVADVVSFQFPVDVVTTCTTSLVTPIFSDGTVKLAHFSVKEFLVCNETEGEWYQFSALSAHDAIANQTINSLLEITKPITKISAVQQPLLTYAAKYWDRHLKELGDLHVNITTLQEKVDCLFTEPDIYFNWVRLADFEWDYVWHKSFGELKTPLYNASEKGLKPTIQTLLTKGANPMESRPDGWGNALLAAAEQGHLDALLLLLIKMDEIPRKVTAAMFEQIKPTEANRDKLRVILDLLWDKGALHDQARASLRIIDETLTESAAENRTESGQILMDLLLDRKEKMGMRITESILSFVLRNSYCGDKIMHLLLNRCGEDIRLTPSLMRDLISSYKPDAGTILLSQRVNDIALDEESLGTFSVCKKEVVEMLLHERGKEIQITQKVLITAARFARDPQTVSLLLNSREPGTDISKEVILACAGNVKKGSEIMDLMLDEYGQDVAIDDEIIQEITRNRYEGLGMMKALLRRQQAGFVVTEQTICNAAEYHNREMLELLVHNTSGSKLDLPITDRTLRCVAVNYYHGEDLMAYLFDLQGHSLPVSEDTLVSIADVHFYMADYVLTFILERWSETPVTDRLLEAACCLPDAVGLLLDRRSDRLPIERMIQMIAKDRVYYGRGLKVLLDRHLVEVNEWLVEMTAGNYYTLEIIYQSNPEFPVTPKIVVTAASNIGSMRILLDRRKNQVLITEEVIKASLVEPNATSVISLLLTRLEPEAVPVTEDILIFAIKNSQYHMIRDLSPLELLLKQRRDLNLSTVWEAIWQDPEIDPFSLADAADALFQYGKFDVSDRMLERLPSECFDKFIRSCMQYRVPLPTTEAAFELIVGRSDLNTVDIFLEDHPDFPITERHFEAAERNSRRQIDKDGLLLLLSTKSGLS